MTNAPIKINRKKSITLPTSTDTSPAVGGYSPAIQEKAAEVEASIVEHISLDLLIPDPTQPRRKLEDEDIDRIAQSIEANGLYQIPMVTQVGSKFMLVSGHHRLEAHRRLGRETMPCTVRQIGDKATLLKIQLGDNLQRTDLTPLDTAAGIQKLAMMQNISFKEAGRSLFLKRSQIAEYEALVNPSEAIQQLHDDGVTNDRRALYELKKLESVNPKAAIEAIEKVRQGAEEGAKKSLIRQVLQKAVKQEKTKQRGEKLEKATQAEVVAQNNPLPEPCYPSVVHTALTKNSGVGYTLALTTKDYETVTFTLPESKMKDLLDQLSEHSY